MTSTSFVEELDAADAVASLECEEVLLFVLFDGTVRALSVEDGCELWRVIPSEDPNPRLPMASYEESLGDINNNRKGAFRQFKSLIPGLGAAAKEVFTWSVDGRYLQRIDGLLSTGAPRFGTLHSTNSSKCEYCEVDAITGKVLAASIRDASLRARRRTEMSHFGGQEGDEARTLVITRETKVNEGFEQLTGNSWTIRVNVVDVGGKGPRPDSTPPSVTRGDGSQAAIGAFPEGAILPKSSMMSTSDGGGSFVESDALKLSQVVSVCVSGGIKLYDPLTRETVWDVELDSPVIQAYLVSVPKRLNLRSVQKLGADRGRLVRSGTDSSLDTSSCPSQTPVSPIGSTCAGLPSSPLLSRWVTRRQANSALLQVTPIPVTCERPTAFPHSPATPASCTSTSSRSTTHVFPLSPEENATAGSLVPSNGSPNSTRRCGGYFDADRRFLFIPVSSEVELDGFPRTESEVLAERYEVQGPDIDGGGIFTVMPCSPVNTTPTQRGFPTRSLGKIPTRLSSFPTAPKPNNASNILLIKATPTTSPKSTSSSTHTPTPSSSHPLPSHHSSIPRGPTLAPDSRQFQFPIPSFLRQTYQLVGRLGKGGYGVVFLIKPYHVNVTFALKAVFFNPGQIRTDDARRRILNEVEIAATLKSEHFLRPGNTWIEPVTPQLVSWLAAAPDLAVGGSDGIDTTSLPIVEVLESSIVTASEDASVADTSVVTDVEYASALRSKFFDGITSSATTTTVGQVADPFSTSTTTTFTSDSTSSSNSSPSDPSSVPEDESAIDNPPGSARGPTPTPLKDDNGQLIVRDTPGTLVVTSQSPGPFSLTDPTTTEAPRNTWSMVNASPSRTPYILFLQMEFCPLTLTQWMLEKHQTTKSSSEVLSQMSYQRTARSLSIQLFRALSVLQRRSLLHRDIKPSNLFLVSSSNEVRCGDHGESDSSDDNSSSFCEESYILKVGDFGLATCVSFAGLPSAFEGLSQRGSVEDLTSSPIETTHTKTGHNSCMAESATSRNLTSGIGSPLYAAPEQWHGSQYGTKADVFSAGLVLVELFCLFDTASERSHVFNDIRRRGPTALPDELLTSNPPLAAIIGKCLELSPSNRNSATETLKLLKHLVSSSS